MKRIYRTLLAIPTFILALLFVLPLFFRLLPVMLLTLAPLYLLLTILAM